MMIMMMMGMVMVVVVMVVAAMVVVFHWISISHGRPVPLYVSSLSRSKIGGSRPMLSHGNEGCCAANCPAA